MKNALEEIGKEIKEKRLTMNVTSERLAKDIGVSRATISAIESGSPKVSIGTYYKVFDYLKIIVRVTPTTKIERKRATRITKVVDKRSVDFIIFCIESYADYINKDSNEVYLTFKKTKLIGLLKSDYEDMHGMGKEYLCSYFDKYIEVNG